jgi:hypothetical protein
LGPPQPPPPRGVGPPPPPPRFGGRGTLALVECRVPIPTRGHTRTLWYSLYIYTYFVALPHTCILYSYFRFICVMTVYINYKKLSLIFWFLQSYISNVEERSIFRMDFLVVIDKEGYKVCGWFKFFQRFSRHHSKDTQNFVNPK